ncbi:MAG: hypothetical protein Rpha_2051 [Candidatus Ruthia sp. Apha_13_S6]|nr:hypothetical protein [Candidatus Ruthia sp. Apha_13_S6]
MGVQKKWNHFDKRLTFEGVYAYAGEFFFLVIFLIAEMMGFMQR